MLFKDLENINSNIAAELSKHNINEMTDVQAKTYKHIYNNKDLIVCSGTGTGKHWHICVLLYQDFQIQLKISRLLY